MKMKNGIKEKREEHVKNVKRFAGEAENANFAIEDMQGALPFAVIKEETSSVLCLTL